MSFILYTVLGATLLASCCQGVTKDSTKLVIVLFRHGDRTPDAGTLYPRDPYINETYYPFGLGQLTTRGKQREYEIGQMLRNKYNSFLGNTYFPGAVEAVSTNVNRTKNSLALVLASLYPPAGGKLEWSKTLNWDPIPYNYLSFEHDLWMTTSLYFCTNYALRYEKYLESPAGQAIIQKYSELFQFLSDNTGLQVTTPLQAWLVYSCLQSQDEWQLKLPLWTKSVYPDILEQATVDALKTFVATLELKQLAGGLMLKKIIDNMKAKKQNTLSPSNLKIILWSAHDINVAYLSGALNQPITRSVPYGAYYIFELVEIRGVDYVLVFTIDYKTLKQVQVRIPGCELNCPFVKFVKLLEKNIPVGNDPCGINLPPVQKYQHRRDYYMGKISQKSIVDHYVRMVADENILDPAEVPEEVL